MIRAGAMGGLTQSGRMSRLVAVASAILLTCVLFAPARAQDLVSRYFNDDTDPFGALDLRNFARRAELNADQKAAAAEVLENARISLIAARRKMEREQWALSLEIAEIPREKWDQILREKGRQLTAKFRDRCEQIEREYLADLRALTTPKEGAWDGYLRDRRRMAFWGSGVWNSLPDIESILASMTLSEEERRAVREPLEQYILQEDVLVRDGLAYVQDMRNARESAKGDEYDQHSEAFEARRRALVGRAIDAVGRGQKTIADVLTPENAAEFVMRVESHKCERLMEFASATADELVAEVLRISTLSKEQRSQLRAMVRETQGQISRNFRTVLPSFEATSAGRTPPENDERQEVLMNQANAQIEPLMVKLRQKMMDALTPSQKSAFEEGREPPLPWDERRWGEDIERAR